MGTIDEEIKAIEDEIFKTQKNKATEHHIGKLKAKIARLKEEQEKRRKGSSGGGFGFAVKKSGNATVGLVGLPSVGKSTLLNALTGSTDSEVGAYQFTTLTVIPGLLEHRGAKIQILDMPGIITGASKGKGRGREILSVARSVDLAMLLIDATNPETLDVVVRELQDANIRLDQHPPDVVVRRRSRGGVNVQFTLTPSHIDEEYAAEVAAEFKIVNADIVVRQDVTIDEYVDALAANRSYKPSLLVFNKIDQLPPGTTDRLVRRYAQQGWNVMTVSAHDGTGIEALRERLFESLRFVRIYLRPQGGEADYEEPLVLTEGSTVGDVCDNLHRTMRKKFRYAQVWGKSAKFPGQNVGLDHRLKDEDVLTLILRKG